jgi:hypothetical protein
VRREPLKTLVAFVLGFALCGSFMRVWEFDWLGGIASERFDINRDGLQFVSTILGFLWILNNSLKEMACDKAFCPITKRQGSPGVIVTFRRRCTSSHLGSGSFTT